ncbi:MAG: hypothetical protein U0269_15200 [Polyangiales bacterium]
MPTEPGSHGAPDGTVSTRHTTPLTVLLASAGTPPFDAQRAALAATRLFDAFVLAPERKQLFIGPRALFGPHATGLDPRHDALARILRTIAFGLRSRAEAHESLSGTRDLVRGAAGISAARIEGHLGGFDPRRGAASVCTADVMIGSERPGTDPIDAQDAGVIRRLLALSLRGAMATKPARTSGLVTDLGGATLVLAVLDLAANPRSALRAARGRVSRSGRIGADESAWPRDVGQALREWLAHAIASASPSGSTGRELTREPALPADVLDAFAVSLALAVYNGFAPERETPLVVAGAGPEDAFTAAPVVVGPSVAAVSSPVLGLFSRIDFVGLPFAPVNEAPVSVAKTPAIPLTQRASSASITSVSLDEQSFTRARDWLRGAKGALGSTASAAPAAQAPTVLEASVDPFAPAHTFSRTTLDAFASRVAKVATSAEPSTQIVTLVGPRTARAREALATVGKSLLNRGPLSILAPKPETRTLAFETLSDPVAQLRRADIARWVGTDLSRAIEYNVEPGANLLINATALERVDDETATALARLCSDLVDRAMPRSLVVLLGAPSYGAAATLVAAMGKHAELETSDVPLRGGAITLVRIDAPPATLSGSGRALDEAQLARLCEPFTGQGPLAELCARAMLAPAEARFRSTLARAVALSLVNDPPAPQLPVLPSDVRAALGDVQRALARAVGDSHGGPASRRALQAGVCAQHTARASLAAGMIHELVLCARTEAALTVGEYWAPKGLSHAARLDAVAKNAVIPWLLAANTRASLVVADSVAELVGHDGFEPVSAVAPWIVAALGAKSADFLERTPLIVSRGPMLEMAAAVSVSVGAPHARGIATTPTLALEWTVPPTRDATLGIAGSVVAGAYDAVRRVLQEGAVRTVPRDSRTGAAILVEVICDSTLTPERVKLLIPLKAGASEALLQTTALEVGARVAGALGADGDDWIAEIHGEDGIDSEVPLAEALLARDCAARWVRSLRVLPRWFPQDERGDGHYVEAPAISTASELGLLGAMLVDRKIPGASEEARAVVNRLQLAADELSARAKELASSLPVVLHFADGPAREVIERTLAVAWFLHANFCCSSPGHVVWAPPGMPGDPEVIVRSLDFDRLRAWTARKIARPDEVNRRVEDVLRALSPRVVIERD